MSSPIETETRRPAGLAALVNRWTPLAITVCLFLGVLRSAVIEPFTLHLPWMIFEEDDFFYYLKIAQNLAHGAGSTFNGIVPTNGYHPLWLLLLTALSFFTTRPHAVLLFLTLTVLVSTMATYFLSRRLIGATGVGAAMASALGAYIAIYSIHLYTAGMEVILTIPLALAVIVMAQRMEWWQSGLWPAACLGLLVSAMVLSRLDSILLAGLFFLGFMLRPELRRSIPRERVGAVAAGLALGLLPLALYFVSNQVFFHTWLPVSGMAKQLRWHHLPSDPAWRSLYGRKPTKLLTLLPVVGGILIYPLVRRRLTPIQQTLYGVTLVFPFVYILVLSCLSDWKIWDWYFYSFRVALCVAFALFCLWRPTERLLRVPVVGAVAALAMIGLIARNHSSVGAQYQLLEVAENVRGFAATHPGVYAMGDRSGMVAYLLPDPVVQTEGLVMDKEFVNLIKEQTPLRDALKRYGVRYYIATTYPPYKAGCFEAAEPRQAGPDSPHMKAEFCEQPAAEFEQSDVRTMIFDLGGHP